MDVLIWNAENKTGNRIIGVASHHAIRMGGMSLKGKFAPDFTMLLCDFQAISPACLLLSITPEWLLFPQVRFLHHALPHILSISIKSSQVDSSKNAFLKIIFYQWCYYSCPDLPASTQYLPLPQAIPLSLFMSWVMCISSLVTPLSMLYFTYPCLFCNYVTCVNFLIASPLHPFPTTPHTWQPSKCSP